MTMNADDYDDFLPEEEENAEPQPASQEGKVKLIPTIHHWQRNYGASCDGNDQKAIRIFREYEPHERLRRLQHELMTVRDTKVSMDVLHNIVGKKRMQKHQGYEKWAALMLMWIAAKR